MIVGLDEKIEMIVRGARALLARDKPQAIRAFSQWMNGDLALTDEQIELLLLAMRTFRQKLARPRRLSDEALGRITVPTLLMLAADTKLYDPETVAERARRLLPDVTIEIVPDAGHGVVFQYPDRIIARLLQFIDHERATGPRPR